MNITKLFLSSSFALCFSLVSYCQTAVVTLPGLAKIVVSRTGKSIFPQRYFVYEIGLSGTPTLKYSSADTKREFYTIPIGSSALTYEIRIEHSRDNGTTWVTSNTRVISSTIKKSVVHSEDLAYNQDWNDTVLTFTIVQNQLEPALNP